MAIEVNIPAILGVVIAGGVVGGTKGIFSAVKSHTKLREKVEGHATRIEMIEETIGTVARDTKQTAQDVAFLRGQAERQ